MVRNPEEGSSPSPPDPTVTEHYGRRQIDRNSDLTRDLGHGVADSISREWTDEKHSLYLKSMEASFVRQLHNHEYHSMDMLGWNLEGNLSNSDLSLQSNAKDSAHGCWKKFNFGRAQPKLEKVMLPDVLEKDSLSIDPMHSGGKKTSFGIMKSQKTTSCRAATSSKDFHSCYHQGYMGSAREVSDQNFVDEDYEETQISNPCRTKKMKRASNDAIIKDQVFPFRESPGTTDLNDNFPSPREQNMVNDNQ